jgi:hypothetical protein
VRKEVCKVFTQDFTYVAIVFNSSFHLGQDY